MSYTPKAGSPVAAMVEYLGTNGGNANTEALAAVAGCRPGNVAALLAAPMKHGLVHRAARGVYAAGPGEAKAKRKPRAAALLAPVIAEEPADQFSCDFFTDGDLVICNPRSIGENNVTLSAAQTKVLVDFITRLGGLTKAA